MNTEFLGVILPYAVTLVIAIPSGVYIVGVLNRKTWFDFIPANLNAWGKSNPAIALSEKRRIKIIIEQIQDAIIGLNEKNEILFINTVAENILDLKEQQVVGRPAAHFIRTNDLFKAITENNDVKPFKIALNGKESFFQLENRKILIPGPGHNALGIPDSEGKPVARVYILRNITEFKERDEAKTNFIATISHELKTPICSIKMSLKLLRDKRIGPVNPQQLELVEHIHEDSERLLKITSELLDLSQVETGNILLSIIVSDPVEIVNRAIDAVKLAAEIKGVRLEIVVPPHLSKILADIEKTAWVLINFLSNAIRYSPERSIVIIRLFEKRDYVIFSVKDIGKGIDEQYLKRLFERYFQVPADGQNKNGSGLGLAISKEFIEAQHGRIWLESAIDEGSTFYFSLPSEQHAKV